MSIGDSPQLSEGGSAGAVDSVDDCVFFRLYFGGKFVQSGSGYRYEGGESFMESVQKNCSYSELLHKLNEKFDCDLSVKYLVPGDDLDPDTLVSVLDDNDLKELYREFFTARKNSRSQSTFRIRLFLFEAVEDEDMTPEDFEDDTFYGVPVDGMVGPHGGMLEGRSSYGSNLSTSSNPAHSSDLEASGAYPHMHYSKATAWSLPYHHQSQFLHPAVQLPLPPRPLPVPSPAVAATPGATPDEDPGEWSSHEWLQRLAASVSKQGQDMFLQSAPMVMDGKPPRVGAVVLQQQVAGQAPLEGIGEGAAAAAGRSHRAEQLRLEQPQPQLLQQQPQGGQAGGQTGGPFAAVAEQLPPWDGDNNNNQGWLAQATGQAGEGGAMPASSPHLPSHISAFGDMGVGVDRLPSHISAFGEGSRGDGGDLGDLQPYVDGLDLEMDLGSQDPCDPHSSYGGPRTQELGPLDLEGMQMSSQPPTPEILALASSPPTRRPAAPLPMRGLSGVAEGTEGGTEGGGTQGGGHGEEDDGAALAGMQSVHYVSADDVQKVATIGDGAFGEVVQAEVDMFGTVAVKWLKAGKLQKHAENFKKEAAMLSRLNHPNVLRFYGIVTEANHSGNVLGIITEYMRGGSLASYLRHRARTGYLSLRERCNLALHAARGMAYLHELKVVHFDLKPDNLLIDGDNPATFASMVVKVADFGLSKHKFTAYVSTCRDLRGTLPYMAPELVAEPSRVNEKADLWSMGVVMWEMLTLEVPYRDLAPQQILMSLMTGSAHLTVPEWCEPEWRGLLEACLDISPARRPSFKELTSQLERIRNAAA